MTTNKDRYDHAMDEAYAAVFDAAKPFCSSLVIYEDAPSCETDARRRANLLLFSIAFRMAIEEGFAEENLSDALGSIWQVELAAAARRRKTAN